MRRNRGRVDTPTTTVTGSAPRLRRGHRPRRAFRNTRPPPAPPGRLLPAHSSLAEGRPRRQVPAAAGRSVYCGRLAASYAPVVAAGGRAQQQTHASNDRSLLPRQDRRAAHGRRLESRRRRERPVRARPAGRLAGRLRALRPVRAPRGGGRGQARQHQPRRGTGSRTPLRRATRRAVRVPVERRGSLVPRPRDRRPRAEDRHLLFPGRPGTADRRPQESAGPVRRRDRSTDRRSRLPDRLHRGAVGRSIARPAQAARGNGDRDRQDPHGGGLRQAAVRGGHRHPRPVPGVDRIALAGQAEDAFNDHLRDYPCHVLRPGRASTRRSASPSPPCRR